MFSKSFEELSWSSPPDCLVLNVNEVHLWKFSLDLPFIGHLRANLSLEELLHAERFFEKMERRRFISGCGQLRMILSRYLQVEPVQISLGYALSGEPVTLGMPRILFFDWARADDLALVAVSAIQNVTLELERICDFLPTQTLADHFFQIEERWDLLTSPPNERQHYFFRRWTGEEAFRRCGGETSLVLGLTPAEGFAAAIAAKGEDWQLRCWEC